MANHSTDLATFATAVEHMSFDRLVAALAHENRRAGGSSDYVNHDARATMIRDEITRRLARLDHADRRKLDR